MEAKLALGNGTRLSGSKPVGWLNVLTLHGFCVCESGAGWGGNREGEGSSW